MSGISAGAVSGYAIARRGERSLVALAVVALGLFILVFLVGAIMEPAPE